MEGRMKAETLQAAALASLITVVLALSMASLGDAQNIGEQNHICNGNRMPDFEYEQATIPAIDHVVTHTSDLGYHLKASIYHLKASSSLDGKTGYAIGACNGVIDKGACDRCMSAAYSNLLAYCVAPTGVTNYAAGAQIQLVDCRLRWEIYDFDW